MASPQQYRFMRQNTLSIGRSIFFVELLLVAACQSAGSGGGGTGGGGAGGSGPSGRGGSVASGSGGSTVGSGGASGGSTSGSGGTSGAKSPDASAAGSDAPTGGGGVQADGSMVGDGNGGAGDGRSPEAGGQDVSDVPIGSEVSGPPPSAVSVLTNRNDNQRSGSNTNESILNTSNVNQTQFGSMYSFTVDGQVYAQPLYLSYLKFNDGTTKNTLFVATEHNTVYAFDADGATTTPIWSKNLGPSGPTSGFGCGDMNPETGITSTPVIDTTAGMIYVVSKGVESGAWVMRLHAMDIKTGQEGPGSPIPITATVNGTGDGSVGGKVAFNPETQLNRPGLLLDHGNIYLAFASLCDHGPYHGWILGYSYANGAFTQTHVFNISPNGSEGGIWQSGVGLFSDADGIYFAAGNGSTNPMSTPPDVSESVARLSFTDLSIQDFWTPTGYAGMNAADNDISCGATLLPHDRVITGTKGGQIFLLDRTNLGKYNAAGNKNLQTLAPPNGGVYGGPVYYHVPGGPEWVYLWPVNSPLLGYQMDPATYLLKTTPTQQNIATPAHPGGILTLSSNGTAGSGVLWASAPQADAWHTTAAGTLYAFDASDISKVLWTSEQNSTRDTLGNFAKFTTPTVVNGRVFMATFSNAVRVYGLLGKGAITADAGTGAADPGRDAATDKDVASITVSFAKDILPMLQTNCVGCHGPTLQDRGVRVDTYANVSASLSLVTDEIVNGYMPPTGPLSDADRQLFQNWVDQGALNN
jgi:hypothetical protein